MGIVIIFIVISSIAGGSYLNHYSGIKKLSLFVGFFFWEVFGYLNCTYTQSLKNHVNRTPL